MKEEPATCSALPGIKKDLDSLKENFPDMTYVKDGKVVHVENEIENVRNEIGKKYENGKKTTRGNEHVSLILNIVNEIIKNSIKGISEEAKEIPITLNKEKYKPQIDLHFKYNNIHIFLECKYWLYDTNQMRSAILNSILLKKYGKEYENFLFYIIGGGDSLFNKNSKLERGGNVLKPLILFALDKGYIKGIYGIRKLKELMNEIKNLKDNEMRNKQN